MKRLLVIAGSDSSAGAGIQADLKAAGAFGVYAMTVITAVTAQNTRGIRALKRMPPDLVAAQIEACLSDIGADAVKIGMLGDGAIVRAVADALRARAKGLPIVLDPVMISTSGTDLLAPAAVRALKRELFPLATLVTPNLPEARALVGLSGTKFPAVETAGRALVALGPKAALIKGGHATRATVDDVLVWERGVESYSFPRLKTRHTHGTGCTYASAIAANLALGFSLPVAVGRARDYVQAAIAAAPGLGKGHGPLNHFVDPRG